MDVVMEEWSIKRILIALAVLFVIVVGIGCVELVLFARAITSEDPYPKFMTAYQQRMRIGAHTYEEAKRAFSDFVVESFPIGSDAKAAIAKITGGGFQVTSSASGSVELLWRRHSGPCSEQYSIAVSQNGDGAITNIVGKLWPICL
jgi:predicted PurR-regulated permease PerM